MDLFYYRILGVLLGRESWHIGASGLIYGIAAFIFVSGIIRKNTRLLGLALIVLFLYGGLVYGLFPDKVHPEISWESHLLGALCGLILAVYFRKRKVITDFSDDMEQDDPEQGMGGINEKGFDGRGNYTFGVSEQIIFPEIDIDKISKISGMDITFVTTAKTDKECLALLKEFGLPFKNQNK